MSIADPPAASLLPTHKDLPCTDSRNSADSSVLGRRVTHKDLPETDGKPVENTYQPLQAALLTTVLNPVLERLHPDGNFLIGADTAIYWRMTKDPMDGCRAPDWFYIANVPRLFEGEFRRSYVMWEEVVSPLLVVECGSEERDGTPYRGKFWVYEQAIKAPYYAIWDPFRVRLEVFESVRLRYQPVAATEHGRFRIPPMEVDFGIWEGTYQGCHASWLRAWNWNGNLIPTPEERAERLAARLRELGVDPDAV